MGLGSLQQHLHQGAVLKDPAHRLIRAAAKVCACEGDPLPGGAIAELQSPEGSQGGLKGMPQPQSLQQGAAGMGQGVSPGALPQLLWPQGVTQVNPPASIRQGQGRQGTCGARTMHPSGQH